MTGALVQLVATGNQDLYLTYKPQFTYLKRYILNIHNFQNSQM